MANILLVNPNKWGRGITHIWITSHASMLRQKGHSVRLFDTTFYSDWTDDEVGYNTKNEQYRPTNYKDYVKYKDGCIDDLQSCINEFKPDVIFWSAISSHIHGEGEYVNVQFGHDLVGKVDTKNALKVTAGLQATAVPELMCEKYPLVDYFVRGESELALAEIADNFDSPEQIKSVRGLVYRDGDKVKLNENKTLSRI